MFWQFLLAASVAIGLIQLGALYVWVSVLEVNRCAMIPPMECSGSVALAVLAYRRAGVLCFPNCSPSGAGFCNSMALLARSSAYCALGLPCAAAF